MMSPRHPPYHDPVAAADRLYSAAVTQARRPEFYAVLGVPDTVDGRFEMIALHVFLLLYRLKHDHPASAALAQAVFDAMFRDMDRSLREMGAGDLGVGRRVKRMAEGLSGRIEAYDGGLESSDEAVLCAAVSRNVYGTVEPDPACVACIAAYMRDQDKRLEAQTWEGLSQGQVMFGDPPKGCVSGPRGS